MSLPRLRICLVLTAVALSGCESLKWPHELKPHRLWRLNRQPASSQNYYYSVADDIPKTDWRPEQRNAQP